MPGINDRLTVSIASGVEMIPGVLPISIYRGDSYNWELRLWQDLAKTIPVDLTNVIPEAQIRTMGAGVGQLVTQFDLNVVLPNLIYMSISSENSEKLYAGTLSYDVQLTWPTGEVGTILTGNISVTADVSV